MKYLNGKFDLAEEVTVGTEEQDEGGVEIVNVVGMKLMKVTTGAVDHRRKMNKWFIQKHCSV